MVVVKMYHDDPVATAGPTEADVPEEGIPMMRRAGWYLAEEKKMIPPLESMTVAEMREYAKAHTIQIPATATTKAEIVAILNKE
jgi:hypothetical protein